MTEPFQRLDTWLWCARFARSRTDCAALAASAVVRINRQTTDKPHAKIRRGDVLTLPIRGDVVVLRVQALAARRGPAATARTLYELLAGPDGTLATLVNDGHTPSVDFRQDE